MSKQVNRFKSDWQRPEKTLHGPFLNDVTAATTAAMKLTVFGPDVKDYRTLLVLCLQVQLIGKPEGMAKQTCTHWKSDFLTKSNHRYAFLR